MPSSVCVPRLSEICTNLQRFQPTEATRVILPYIKRVIRLSAVQSSLYNYIKVGESKLPRNQGPEVTKIAH